MEYNGCLGADDFCIKDLRFAPQRRDCVGGFVGTGLGNTMILLLGCYDSDTGA